MTERVRLHRHHVRVGSIPISYQVAGAGEPVVLVHGLSGSTRWWAKNLDALAAHFHVHLIDLIGFGESRSEHPFVLEEAAEHLVGWLDQLGIERAHVVGHSMGGFITAVLAADFPSRVDRLVLVDAAALPLDGALRRGLGLLRAVRHAAVDFLPTLAMDAYRAGPTVLWHATRELLRADIRAKLTHIDRPAIVVWGEHDTLIPLDIGVELARRLSDAELIVIQGAGHNPMWDRPEDFNRVVVEFLRRPS